MNPIRAAIERPIAVVAAVLMALMFGLVALNAIPIQLAPDVERPVISIETEWRGASPVEVEREIVERQEDALKGLEGVEEVRATAEEGEAEVTLEFAVGTDMDKALLLVANRLDRVGGYPDEADEPTLSTAGGDDSAIAWFTIKPLPGNAKPIAEYGPFAEDVIQDRLQRVAGVARVDVFGGLEREMQVVVAPEQLARYRLTVPEIVGALREAGIALTAGTVDEGKRRYVVRAEGDFTTVEDVENVVLRSLADEASGRIGRLTVGDIAEVRIGYKDPTAYIRDTGEKALVARAIRETGANVIETMQGIRAAVAELNANALPVQGLSIEQTYDETVYIDSAIDLVTSNIYIGGALAALVLLLFLRSLPATLIVSVAIPVSVVASFVAMAALGRSLNVVSLAGIAFAVGMVVDAAIVVLENIYRLRQEGVSKRDAAYKGAAQVWGAIFVSALTTVMVFIPVLVMRLEVGQLFRDIAVAISTAVLLSLVVAVTLVPAMASRLLGRVQDEGGRRLPLIDPAAGGFARLVLGLTRRTVRSSALSLAVVGIVTGLSVATAWFFLPKLEYLPEGNRNLVFGFVIPPPGYNLDTMETIAARIEDATRELWVTPDSGPPDPDGPPRMKRFFFVTFSGNVLVGAAAEDPARAAELIPILSAPVFEEPGTFGFMRQPSIFGRGVGGARSIDLDVSGNDLNTVLETALKAAGRMNAALPREAGNQFRPDPGLELGAPEVRLVPDRVRLADADVSTTDFAQSVDAFNDGLRVAEISVDGERIDLTLMGPEVAEQTTEAIGSLPIVTREGRILPVSSLAEVRVTAGPTEIRHVEGLTTVTLRISPAPNLSLEEALDVVDDQVVGPLQAEGLPPGVRFGLSGTADKLSETFDAMVLDLGLALVIVYLVMAVLFESFLYPLVIMVSVPLAAAGGVVGLAVLNLFVFQPLDMLTLLGFVILVGIVVNNAILIVHQAIAHLREDGLTPEAAIQASVRNRLRPIFMSTLTSVFGMLPLVLFPGAGSELYRGLGSVVVGGLSLSALLTLLLIPPLLGLVMRPLAKFGIETPQGAAAPAE